MPLHLFRSLLILIFLLCSPLAWAQEDDGSDLPGYSGEIDDDDDDDDDPDSQVEPEPPEGAEEGEEKVLEDPMALENLMREILQVYLDMQKYLAEDSTWRVKRSGGLIALKVKNFDTRKIPRDLHPLYRDIPKQLRKAARNVYRFTDIESLRHHFRDLSRPMATWANLSKPVGIDVLYCPVYNGSWLQQKGPTKNPYYGTKMLSSGKVVHSGPPIPTAAPGVDSEGGEEGDKKKSKKAAAEDIDDLMED